MAFIVSHKLLVTDRTMNGLFLQRWYGADFNPGGIDLPGGKPEAADNSPLDTAIRETGEEIGLWLRPSSCSPEPLVELEYSDGENDYWKTAWHAQVDELPRQTEFLPSYEHIGSVVLSREAALEIVRQPLQIDALRQLSI